MNANNNPKIYQIQNIESLPLLKTLTPTLWACFFTAYLLHKKKPSMKQA